MAGYKQTVLDDGAVSLWSFDGDAYSILGRNLLANPQLIIDDAGDNLNPAIFHSNTFTAPFGYRMGLPGLVEIESGAQTCLSFGYYGKQAGAEPYPKAFMEVPHTSTYAFSTAFSIEFVMKKTAENSYMSNENVYSFTRPIIRKDQLIDFYYGLSSGGGNKLYCRFPSGNLATLSADKVIGVNPAHIVIVWGISSTGNNQFGSTESIYINARLEYTASMAYSDIAPILDVNTPWEIGGTIEDKTHHQDRNTSALTLDQIAVYNKALTDYDIARHYKKIFEYDRMIMMDGATNYWVMDDPESIVNWSAANLTNGYDGRYVGDIFTIKRGMAGPPNIPNSKSTMFVGGSEFAVDITTSAPVKMINPASNYCVEFWFTATTSTRGVLFLAQQDTAPYQGPMVQINWKDNDLSPGYIQFSENNTTYINSAGGSWNDGKWHHCCIQRNGTTLELWLDGNLSGQLLNIEAKSMGYTGWIHMMNSRPGFLRVDGHACRLALYSFALKRAQIAARYQYSIIYRIRGTITLQGIPTKATVRVYDHYSGELITEITSNVNTGSYEYILPNNNLVDLLVFNKDDRSVRYRAYGPVNPAECQDLAINI